MHAWLAKIGAAIIALLVEKLWGFVSLRVSELFRKKDQEKKAEKLKEETDKPLEPRDPEEIKREEDAFNS
jgi:hypothetical protein